MLKPGAQIWIPGGTPDRGTRAERAAGGAAHAALLWSREPRFDARLRTVPLVPPFAYKYPEIFRARGGEVLRSFSVVLE